MSKPHLSSESSKEHAQLSHSALANLSKEELIKLVSIMKRNNNELSILVHDMSEEINMQSALLETSNRLTSNNCGETSPNKPETNESESTSASPDQHVRCNRMHVDAFYQKSDHKSPHTEQGTNSNNSTLESHLLRPNPMQPPSKISACLTIGGVQIYSSDTDAIRTLRKSDVVIIKDAVSVLGGVRAKDRHDKTSTNFVIDRRLGRSRTILVSKCKALLKLQKICSFHTTSSGVLRIQVRVKNRKEDVNIYHLQDLVDVFGKNIIDKI